MLDEVEAVDVLPAGGPQASTVLGRIRTSLQLGLVHRDREERGAAVGQRLGARTALGGRERLDRPAADAVRAGAGDARIGAQRGVGGEQQLELFLDADRERVALARAGPVAGGRRGGGEGSRRSLGRRRRDAQRASQRRLERGSRGVRGGGEPPPAAGAHAHADAGLLDRRDARHAAVAHHHPLGRGDDVARVGVLAPRGGGGHELAQLGQHGRVTMPPRRLRAAPRDRPAAV